MHAITEMSVSVAIIGRPHGHEFASFLAFVRHHPAVRIVGEFSGIDHAVEAGLAETIPADMVLVLQEYSDQYSLQESNQLIGRMMFGRVFCCYGPWCQADGRSHDIWPVSTRIAVASAEMIVSMELDAFSAGLPPQSPMSAAEEVFAHRICPVSSSSQRPRGTALIISAERPLRNTVDAICRDWGLETQQIPMRSDAARVTIERTSLHPEFAIVDLDPADAIVQDVVSDLRESWPALVVLGMSVFPQASFEAGELHAIIDKTELLTQLQWHLSQNRT